MKKTFLFFATLFLMSRVVSAQELSCTVTLSTDQIQVNEQRGATQIYPEIQRVIQEFLNSRRWTNDEFQPEERIKCSLAIIFTKASSSGDYEANARFQVSRPVYGTAYETVLLNYVDKSFNFKYVTGTPLNYNDNSFSDNLTQMLAFYAYTALAFDYDSFSKMGGTPFVQKALNVVNNAQTAGLAWTSTSDIRNRYWLSENLMNQQLQPLRDGFYTYHRLAMDNFANNPIEGRRLITEYLNVMKQVNAARPGQPIVRLFFEAKSQELVNIFSEAPADERKKIATLLSSLDPTNSDAYRKLGKL